MALTYTPITTTTVTGSSVSSVTFSSITGTYTDLFLVIDVEGVSGGSVSVRFNNDTGSNYSLTRLGGNGVTASSNRSSNQTSMSLSWSVGYSASSKQFTQVYFMNYSNSGANKCVIAKSGKGDNAVDMIVGLYRSTSAITEIVCLANTANFAVGSTFTLYGIKAA